jgi:hypothetical protein
MTANWKTLKKVVKDNKILQQKVVPNVRTVKKNKEQLIRELRERGVETQGKYDKIARAAQLINIQLTYEEQTVKEGWVGKPKGALQILWERGFINPDKGITWYTWDGRKDNYDNWIPESSLKHLMSQHYDFANELTLLQFIGLELGITVDRTPKCHPEMAGEGIEYSWACAKNWYRNLPVAYKRTKDRFQNNIKKAASHEIITVERVRRFSRRARRYMMAYLALSLGFSVADASVNIDDDMRATPLKLEKLIKAHKNHRCAMDFDCRFIAGELSDIKALPTGNAADDAIVLDDESLSSEIK